MSEVPFRAEPSLHDIAKHILGNAGVGPEAAQFVMVGLMTGMGLAIHSPDWAREVEQRNLAAFWAWSGDTQEIHDEEMRLIVERFPL